MFVNFSDNFIHLIANWFLLYANFDDVKDGHIFLLREH